MIYLLLYSFNTCAIAVLYYLLQFGDLYFAVLSVNFHLIYVDFSRLLYVVVRCVLWLLVLSGRERCTVYVQ